MLLVDFGVALERLADYLKNFQWKSKVYCQTIGSFQVWKVQRSVCTQKNFSNENQDNLDNVNTFIKF